MKVLVSITGAKKLNCGKCRYLDVYEFSSLDNKYHCALFIKDIHADQVLKSDEKGALRCSKCLKAEVSSVTMVTK